MARPQSVGRQRAGDPERHFLIFCDESGVHGGRFFGVGSLWMPYERRGDFAALHTHASEEHFPPSEMKWHKVKARTLPFFKHVVDEFFRRNWLMFHGLVLRWEDVGLKEFHGNDRDLAQRKFMALLLANKLKRFARPGKKYRIRVDPIPSRYQKADEAAEIIVRRIVAQSRTLRESEVLDSLRTVDSRETPGVQLADLLIGAVVAARSKDASAAPKLALQAHIARHLGWDHLGYDTYPAEQKFNIWRFWEPSVGARVERTLKAIRLERG